MGHCIVAEKLALRSCLVYVRVRSLYIASTILPSSECIFHAICNNIYTSHN